MTEKCWWYSKIRFGFCSQQPLFTTNASLLCFVSVTALYLRIGVCDPVQQILSLELYYVTVMRSVNWLDKAEWVPSTARATRWLKVEFVLSRKFYPALCHQRLNRHRDRATFATVSNRSQYASTAGSPQSAQGFRLFYHPKP